MQNQKLLVYGLIVATAAIFFGFSTGYTQETKKVFKVGTAIVDTSPVEFPMMLDGGFVLRPSKKVQDPLNVRALCMDDGQHRFVIAVLDAVGIPESMVDQAKAIVKKKTGLPPEQISISTTHCHSAPALRFESNEETGRYVKGLADKIASAIIQAQANLQPAQVGWTTGREPRFVFCRRFLMQPGTATTEPVAFTGSKGDIAMMNPGRCNPNSITRTGVPDQTVYLLAFQTLQGKPLALFSNYSTHYAGVRGNVMSADYYGVYRNAIGKLIGAPDNFVAIMSNGTSGDTNCIDFLKKAEDQKYDIDIVGNGMAQTVAKAYAKIKFVDWVPLAYEQREVTLKILKPSAADVAEAKAYFVKTKNPEMKLRNRTDFYAESTVLLETMPNEKTSKLQAIRVGDLGIITMPFEVYSFTGHDIRANSPFGTTFVISLANACNGYLPTADAFSVGGYTTWRSARRNTGPEAEPIVRATSLDMLRQLAK